jgi:enamine deaminase RidA (YjgF/YER057c/UK114 family)
MTQRDEEQTMTSLKTVLSAGVLIAMSTLNPPPATAQDTKAKTTIVNPDGLYDPAPNGYSHAVIASGRRIVMVAGQGGEDASGALSPDFADQVKQAYANLRRVLDAVGARPDQVAKLTTYVAGYDQSLLPAMTKEVTAMFGAALPAQTLVPVPRLALDGMLFEVDAVAVLD